MQPAQNDSIIKILSALDNVLPAPAPDFFYSRLIARLQRENIGKKHWLFYVKPAFLSVCLCFLIAVNLYVLTNLKKQNKPGTTVSSEESFASAYSLNSSSTSVYNENDIIP